MTHRTWRSPVTWAGGVLALALVMTGALAAGDLDAAESLPRALRAAYD